jgi:hypothetical protein
MVVPAPIYTKAASRYCQLTEPVIVMVGKGICATERHGQDGRLWEKGGLKWTVINLFSADLTALEAHMACKTDGVTGKEDFASKDRGAIKNLLNKDVGQSKWSGQSCNSIMLE